MFVFKQSTGQISDYSGAVIGTGYSGSGKGINNPDMQSVPDVGPIPCGLWVMEVIVNGAGEWTDYKQKKSPVIRLTPKQETETFGRSGFLIHGREAGEIIGVAETEKSSLGCIIQDHQARVSVARNADKLLRVIP